MSDEKLALVLKELRQEFARILGEKLDQVLLFGSRARGDAKPDSDVDILLVIKGEFDYWKVLDQSLSKVTDLSLQNDLVISRVLLSKEEFEKGVSPFLLNVRREAVPI